VQGVPINYTMENHTIQPGVAISNSITNLIMISSADEEQVILPDAWLHAVATDDNVFYVSAQLGWGEEQPGDESQDEESA